MQAPLLFLFGLAVGTMGTMLGVGGGFLHVPVFMLVLGLSPQEAVGSSIAIIFINTLGGSLVYYHQGRMDVELAKKLSIAVAPGAVIGPFIVDRYSNGFFYGLFSLALCLGALNFVFGSGQLHVLPESLYDRKKTITDAFGHSVSYSTNMGLGWFGTFVIGFLSNLLGVGGGIVHVPFLISVLRIPTHVAIGTSHAILCASSALGTLMFLALGHINVNVVMPTGIGAILGATIGAELARNTRGLMLRRMLGVVLAFMGLKMIFR